MFRCFSKEKMICSFDIAPINCCFMILKHFCTFQCLNLVRDRRLSLREKVRILVLIKYFRKAELLLFEDTYSPGQQLLVACEILLSEFQDLIYMKQLKSKSYENHIFTWSIRPYSFASYGSKYFGLLMSFSIKEVSLPILRDKILSFTQKLNMLQNVA